MCYFRRNEQYHCQRKEQRETIDALLQQLQKAIEEKYFSKTQEIIEIKGMLAIQEQQLA